LEDNPNMTETTKLAGKGENCEVRGVVRMNRARYTVLVDDNFHYQKEDERYELGRFETAAEAVAACQRRVDENLRWLHAQQPGSSPAELYDHYRSFGEDPFVVAEGERVDFSAWNYAKERSEVVAR
jgi:hypothetical protein